MVLLAGRLPVVPLAHLAERLHAEIDLAAQRVLRLQLVAESGYARLVGAPAEHALEEQVRVPADRARVPLEKRADHELVALLAALARNLDLGDEAHVHGVLVRLGELELVLPFECVVVRADTRRLLVLEIRLGEPPLRGAVSEAEARSGFAHRLVAQLPGSHLEVDLALAVPHGGRLHVVGWAGVGGGGQAEGCGCEQPGEFAHGISYEVAVVVEGRVPRLCTHTMPVRIATSTTRKNASCIPEGCAS